MSVRWHPPRLPRLNLPKNMIKLFGFTSKQLNPSSTLVGLHSRKQLNRNGKPVHQRPSKGQKGSRSSLRHLVAVRAYCALQVSNYHHCVWPQSPSTISHLVSSRNDFSSVSSFLVEEQLYVLKKGGNINGLIFPLWNDPVQASPISPYTWASWLVSNPCLCVLILTLQWPRWSTQTLTRPTKKIMHLETPKSNTGSVYGHTVPGCSTTHCYRLFCLCFNFCLPWTFSKVWVQCKSEYFHSFITPYDYSKLAVSSVYNSKYATTQVDGRYDIRVLFNGAWRRVGSFFLSSLFLWNITLTPGSIFLDRWRNMLLFTAFIDDQYLSKSSTISFPLIRRMELWCVCPFFRLKPPPRRAIYTKKQHGQVFWKKPYDPIFEPCCLVTHHNLVSTWN